MSAVLEAQALEGKHSYISQFLDLWGKLSLLSKQHLKSVSYIIYPNTQELLDTGGMRNFLVYVASQNSSYR